MRVERFSKETILYSSIFIVAAFSMIILLLALIEEISFYLEIGLLFLLISIFLEYEIIKKTYDFIFNEKKAKDSINDELYKNHFTTEIKRLQILVNFGHYSFFLGLFYIFAHFFVLTLFIAVGVYLISSLIRDITTIKKNYEKEVEIFGHRYIKNLRLIYYILFVIIIFLILWILGIIPI